MTHAKAKILIVDDEPVNVATLQNALKERYDVVTALDGYEAISVAKEQAPDLILLDVMMPELSGFELCRILKSDDAFTDVPVVFITAMDSLEGEATGLLSGGADYITKPFNIELVRLRVGNHIESKQRNDLLKQQKEELIRQKGELEEAFARIKRLEGIIPICMYCKKIRSEQASWQSVEQYVSEHTDALFSHGVCPECVEQARLDMQRLK